MGKRYARSKLNEALSKKVTKMFSTMNSTNVNLSQKGVVAHSESVRMNKKPSSTSVQNPITSVRDSIERDSAKNSNVP